MIDRQELLAAAREEGEEELPPNTAANLSKGWAKMALQILFLGPALPSTFKLVSNRLLVSPVIQTFVLQRIPEAVAEFINAVTTDFDFVRIVPCHFNAPIKAGPKELQEAFSFAYRSSGIKPAIPKNSPWWATALGAPKVPAPVKYPAPDMKTLNLVEEFLRSSGVAKS